MDYRWEELKGHHLLKTIPEESADVEVGWLTYSKDHREIHVYDPEDTRNVVHNRHGLPRGSKVTISLSASDNELKVEENGKPVSRLKGAFFLFEAKRLLNIRGSNPEAEALGYLKTKEANDAHKTRLPMIDKLNVLRYLFRGK